MKRSFINRLFLLNFLVIASIYLISCNSNGNSNENTKQLTSESENEPELIFHENFENFTDENWYQTDPSAWEIGQQGDNSYIALVKQSEYEPKYRSPHNINLIDTLVVDDFVLELKAQSTKEPYNHLDLCVFFGYQDPTHFYYAHLGAEADPNAHSIFIVNDSIRTSIAIERTKSLEWGTNWHDVKIVRDSQSGLIEVYFDDMEKPIMKAKDKHFIKGKIGVGSFDDTGNFDEIKVYSHN